MCFRRWAVYLLLGCLIGSGLRWITRAEHRQVSHRATHGMTDSLLPSVKSPSETESMIPRAAPPSIEELCQSHGAAFLELLIRTLETAGTEELHPLLDALDAEDRLETLVKDLVFLRWTAIDPPNALAAAARHGLLSSAYWAWGKTDPDAALAHAQELGNPTWLAAVVRAIGQVDPDRGIALVNEWLPQGHRESALVGIRATIGHEDPRRALKMALESDHWDHEIVQEWLRKDPVAAFDWLNANLPSRESYEWKQTIDGLLKSHPGRVVEALEGLPEGWLKTNLSASHISYLAFHDMESAIGILEKAPPFDQGFSSDADGGTLDQFRPRSTLCRCERPSPRSRRMRPTSPASPT